MKRIQLKRSTRLQLHFLLGMLAGLPFLLLLYRLPMFRDWPPWILIAFPVMFVVLGLAWFRQCMSPDKTSFKPKWW